MDLVQIGKTEWTRSDQKESLSEFSELYKKRPIKDNSGGMLSAHMFHVWFVAKWLNLPRIIESGIWKGQSTWLLEQACPNAKILSIDPSLHFREYISPSPNVQYTNIDFTEWELPDPKNTLCFFDDHYGVDRIFQANKVGCKHIIYEDNYHDGRGCTFNPTGAALSPKGCFRMGEEKPLEEVSEVYEELPPIYFNDSDYRSAEWAEVSEEEYRNMTPEALCDDPNEFPVFYNERGDYTWITYMRLI